MISRPIAALIIFLSLLPVCFSIRISPDSILIPFEPGFEKEYPFITDKAQNTVVSIEGPLSQYVSIVSNTISTDGRFVVKATLPDQIETPGDNVLFVSVMEGGKDASMMGGVAAIRTPMVVRVPYPGSYANLGLSVANVNNNETGYFTISIDNRGDHNETAKVRVELLSGTSVVGSYTSPDTMIPQGSIGQIVIPFDPSQYTPGPYKAVADVTYGNKTQKLGVDFFIGSLRLDIVGYSTTFRPHKINKVDIQSESRWNTPIKVAYADVTMRNGSQTLNQFKTPSISVPPLGKALLQGYWDASGVGEGNYTMEMVLNYDDMKTTGSAQITVIEGQAEEKSLFAQVNWTIVGLAAAVILLILLNLIVLFRRRA